MIIWFLKSAKFDSLFFFSPLLFVIIFTILIKYFFSESLLIRNDPLWLFLFIILFDVAHVWWTLFRVYFNKLELVKHKKLYWLTPLLAFLLAFLLMLFDRSWTLLFFCIWFFAVYHFIKQQIWFILVYANKELKTDKIDKKMDSLIWWTITWFPMLYWFSNLDTRNYIWFFQWEFIKLPAELFPFFWLIFIIIVLIYILYEIFRIYSWKQVNLIKYAYIFMTFFIWFNWIVWNNSLLIFAFWNVLLHWLNFLWISYLSTKNKIEKNKYQTFAIVNLFLKLWFFWFVFLLLIFAITEEYFWDQFFRYENFELWWQWLFNFWNELNLLFYSIIIWLLATVQLTHYYLDRYIWKKDFDPDI